MLRNHAHAPRSCRAGARLIHDVVDTPACVSIQMISYRYKYIHNRLNGCSDELLIAKEKF